MPQRQQRNQSIKAQYSDMFRWQREQLLARHTLKDIAEALGKPGGTFVDMDILRQRKDAEDQRLAFFQGLGHLPTDQYQKVHRHLQQEHDILLNDVNTLHDLLAQPL